MVRSGTDGDWDASDVSLIADLDELNRICVMRLIGTPFASTNAVTEVDPGIRTGIMQSFDEATKEFGLNAVIKWLSTVLEGTNPSCYQTKEECIRSVRDGMDVCIQHHRREEESLREAHMAEIVRNMLSRAANTIPAPSISEDK